LVAVIRSNTTGPGWLVAIGLLAGVVNACGDGSDASATSTGSGGSGGSVASATGGDAPDPCANDNCHAEASCTPQPTADTGYQCDCKPGWEGDGQDCSDVDECEADLDDCHPTELCTNHDGGFECVCPTGAKPGSEAEGCERRFTSVAAGTTSTCAVAEDKSLWCWGDGSSGELGNDATDDRYMMVQAGHSSQWTGAIGVGRQFACGIKDYGWLWCWGANDDGKLGSGNFHYIDESLPHVVEPNVEWSDLALGDDHVCGVRKDGTLWCWGRNHHGQLGVDSVIDEYLPKQVGAATNYEQVDAGYYNSCAIRGDGTLWCWGNNVYGQLGVAPTNTDPNCGSCKRTPVQVGQDTDWQRVQIGGDRMSGTPTRQGFVCGLRTDGTLWCWGSNLRGQLGDGSTSASTTPQQVGGDTDWADFCTGAAHSCGLKASGTLWCWGSGDSLQSGQADTAPLSVPTQVGSDVDWTGLDCGADHSCATKKDGELRCWGSDQRGQLGRGTSGNKDSPHPLMDDWLEIAGHSNHSCGIKNDSSLWCWGRNYVGQLGQPDKHDRQTPVMLGVVADKWKYVVTGSDHSCAVKTDGSLGCWGQCAAGSCGGAPKPGATGNTDPLYQNWERVAVGYRNACGIKTDGTLWCWGNDSDGQVGNGTPALKENQPKLIDNGPWKDVKTYMKHVCALDVSDHLWCWGWNSSGQVGIDSSEARVYSPQQVFAGQPGVTFISFDLGYSHSCAIKQDGTLWCWGSSPYGVLAKTSKKPEPVGADTDWASVASGNSHVCALKTNNTLWCWGNHSAGQLGIGTSLPLDAGTPQQVGQGSDWASISLGGSTSFASKNDGSDHAWGSNSRGQLGLGDAWLTPGPVLLPEDAP
jgi:alpha-tubulin suppressor-like RCC1 family protein